MSFTGFRALMIFSLLLEGPKSYDEIGEYFRNHPYLKKDSISQDTLRVYINSLKMAGCEITKTKRAEGSKLVLVSHPFELQISKEQVAALKKVYQSIVKVMDVEELIAMDKFFKKIATKTNNENFILNYEKVSLLNNINIDIMKELIDCCKIKAQIVIKYNSPKSGTKDIELISDKIAFDNNKLYLYGTSLEYKQYSYYLVSRILKITDIRMQRTTEEIKPTQIGYEIFLPKEEIRLADNEKIISSDKNRTVIEVTASNLFPVKQRILHYANECRVLYPQSFKDEIIKTLKQMREDYSDGEI